MPRFSFLFIVALIAAAPPAALATPTTPRSLDLFDLGAPSFTSFSSRDGLPASVIVSVRVDRDGFVWIGSPEGVARWDGHRWTPSEDPAMTHPVDSLEVDDQGTLWAAFRNHGIARYDGSRWHVEENLPSRQIRRFLETRDAGGRATLWALTWDQGLLRRGDDGRWIADAHNGELPAGSTLSMAQTRHIGGRERLWAGTGTAGLWYREGDGAWQRYRKEGFDPGQVEYLLATEHDGREELWISVFTGGVYRLTDDGIRAWTRESHELPTDDVYDIAETPLDGGDRAIWVATRSGLVRIHGERTETFGRRHGLPSEAVRGLGTWRSPNGEEVLWLATESGVSRTIVSASAWRTASLMGAHGTGVFAVLVDRDRDGEERLWVGASQDGLGRYEKGAWRYFTAADGALPDPNVRMIRSLPDARGQRTIFVGTLSGHLLRIGDDGAIEEIPTPWPKASGEAVLTMLSRRVDGGMEQWFGLREGGAYRKRGDAWTPFRADGAIGQWRIVAMVDERDASGRSWLWATSNQGLARFDGERWQLLGRAAGMPDTDLLGAQLIEDARHRKVLWVGSTSAGIVRVDVGDPEHPVVLPDDLPAPPDPTAYTAVADSAGRIYVCTNNGVQVLVPQGERYSSQVFTRKDGLIHDECNTNAAFVDARDRYWAGMLGGLTVHDPADERADTTPKALRIVDVRIDGVPVEGSRLDVPPGAREVDVAFALLSWQRESESRFRTQLVGYEAAPGPWSAQNARSFSALPPGHYVLRVEGRDYAGNPSAPAELAVDVEASWWQTASAKIALAGGLVLLGYALTVLRLRTLKAQRRALEQAVAVRTAELNAANARLVELSYVDALSGLANRRRLLEALDPEQRADARAHTTLIFVDVDYFKEYNDSHGHPAGDEALRTVAATLRRCAPPEVLVARYGGEEFACLWHDAGVDAGIALAERIRAAVAAQSVEVPGTHVTTRLTISAGVASAVVRTMDDAHRLLRDADMALYRAKREGRNRVASVEIRSA